MDMQTRTNLHETLQSTETLSSSITAFLSSKWLPELELHTKDRPHAYCITLQIDEPQFKRY